MFTVFKKAATKNAPWPYSSELKAIGILAGTLFVAVSLLSHCAHDQSWFYFSSNPQPILNWCGFIGASLSASLFYLFGGASIMMLFLGMFLFYCVITQKTTAQEWDRIAAYICLVITVSALATLHNIDILGSSLPGGYCGRIITTCCCAWFDTIGSFIFLYSMLLAAFIVVTRLSFIGLIQSMWNGSLCKRIGRFIIAPCWAAFMVIRRMVKTVILYSKSQLVKRVFPQSNHKNASENNVFDAAMMDDAFWDTFTQDITLTQSGADVHLDEKQDVSSGHTQSNPEPEVHDEASLQNLYAFPSLDIFVGVDEEHNDAALMQELEKRAITLQEKLERFEVFGKVTAIKRGPIVTLFEYQPHIDTKISKIVALEDDLALALQATSIRIIAPIPGKSLVGFEVANKNRRSVLLAQLIKSEAYHNTTAVLPMILGVDTIGNPVVIDLAKMPHLLVAGSTGSGKSVGLNAMLISLLCKLSPDDLRLIIIDPKRLEFAPYADIAHLLFPIVTDPKMAPAVLRWVVKQMEQRYEIMAASGARNIHEYRKNAQVNEQDAMPFIVVIIDELADLMMCAGKEVEDAIIRITQMARAAGIHLITATQRPSVDVITGLIKVNLPSRIAFRVTSKIDSRTILDCAGADKLLGRGDMLFLDAHDSLLKRVHGAYVLDKEINQVIEHIRAQRPTDYLDLKQVHSEDRASFDSEQDEMYEQVCQFLHEIDEVSISLLQRRFRIGYNRSARIIDMLEAHGLISPSYGGKTRKVIR